MDNRAYSRRCGLESPIFWRILPWGHADIHSHNPSGRLRTYVSAVRYRLTARLGIFSLT